MAEIITIRKIPAYLKSHQINIRKNALEGRITLIRAGREWRFDKALIDNIIVNGEIVSQEFVLHRIQIQVTPNIIK